MSEIRPTETRQAVGTVHMNSDARGAPLMVRGEQVRTGLGTLAPSMIAYALDGRYSRLRTGVRVTSPAERATFASRQDESSAVDVSVLGDRVPLFQAQTRPDESDPVACDVDLHGVTELILLAQPASPDPPSAANAGSPAGPTSGRNRQPALVDWLDPRLIR
ncbi:MAG: NPCBM/NEW2 domain-containing protein [Candidatus Eisenbacteria bacterium]